MTQGSFQLTNTLAMIAWIAIMLFPGKNSSRVGSAPWSCPGSSPWARRRHRLETRHQWASCGRRHDALSARTEFTATKADAATRNGRRFHDPGTLGLARTSNAKRLGKCPTLSTT